MGLKCEWLTLSVHASSAETGEGGGDACMLGGRSGWRKLTRERRCRRRFGQPGGNSSHQEVEGNAAHHLPRTNLLGATSSGGMATAGAATPPRPSEREKGRRVGTHEGASGRGRGRGRRRGGPLIHQGRGGARQGGAGGRSTAAWRLPWPQWPPCSDRERRISETPPADLILLQEGPLADFSNLIEAPGYFYKM